MVVIHGRVGRPTYLYVHDDVVEFLDARELVSRSPREVQEEIRERHNNRIFR